MTYFLDWSNRHGLPPVEARELMYTNALPLPPDVLAAYFRVSLP